LLVPEAFLLFASLINLGFGFVVYARSVAPRQVKVSLSVLAWACAGWGFTVFMEYLLIQSPSILFWGKMSFVITAITPLAFLLFTLFFPKHQVVTNSLKLKALWLPSILFFGLSFTDQIVSSRGTGPKMFNYGPLYPFFSIYLIGYILMGFAFLIMNYRRAIGVVRLQIKYCLVGMF
jgi:hypothetical protein